MFAKDGTRLDLPFDRNLWEPARDGGPADSVEAPVDPADFGIDPLNYLIP